MIEGAAVNGYLALLGTVLVQAIVAVYVYGKLSQKVIDQGERIGRHEDRLDAHDEKLNIHATQIAHLQGRKGLPLGNE